MSRSIALVSMILVMFVTIPNAEATRYFVNPAALSDGYAISGGFIETNTSGLLMPGDIADYQFILEGEVPDIISSSSLGSSISIHGTVLATDGQIILPFVPSDEEFGAHNDIYFSSRSSSVLCDTGDDCSANINYATGHEFLVSPSIRYYHETFFVPGDIFSLFKGPSVSVPSQSSIVVATVPEPLTVTLTFLGVCVFATRMKQKV